MSRPLKAVGIRRARERVAKILLERRRVSQTALYCWANVRNRETLARVLDHPAFRTHADDTVSLDETAARSAGLL